MPRGRSMRSARRMFQMLLAAALLCMMNVPVSAKENASDLPVSYDCRKEGKSPQIRSQGPYGTCWALSALSGVEAMLLPQSGMLFSADHMTMSSSFTGSLADGGDYHMILAYFAGWQGPVLEEDDPYGDGITAEDADVPVHVLEMRILEGYSLEQMKQAVYDWGPVQSSLHMDRPMTRASRGYYNEETGAFYCPEEASKSHDILILGWDDTFPAEAFAQDPGMDGAFLCQNTWGTGFGMNGLFYVSYADANLARSGIAYCRYEDASPDRHLYQYDPCGWQGRQGYDQDTCWIANVFTAASDECLKGIGFYSLGPKTEYEAYVVHFVDSEWDLGEQRYKIAEGTLDDIGYFTVDIDGDIPLIRGERFGITVRLKTEGVEKPAAVELKKDDFTQNVTLDGKESYISIDGYYWERTQTLYQTNICLKALTEDYKGENGWP